VKFNHDDIGTYAHLYPGDFIADTMHFTVVEHTALRPLLLDLWIRGRVARSKLSTIAGLPPEDWTDIAPEVVPVLLNVRPHILESRRCSGFVVGSGFQTKSGAR
jgi:hypothetical protein